MIGESVLDKAKALSSHAERLRDGAAAEENAERVRARLKDLNGILDEIEATLSAADRLRAQGADVPAVRVDDGYKVLQRSADGGAGLPPPRALKTAKEKLETLRRAARENLAQAWSQWAAARMNELPLHRMVMLPPVERRTEEERRDTLAKLYKATVPSRSDVAEFATVHANLKEALDALTDPAPELQTLLSRLAQQTTLAHLSDDDIALLRQYGVDDQIEVQRRIG